MIRLCIQQRPVWWWWMCQNLKLPVIPGQLATVTLTGNAVVMNYHPLESAIAQLQEQYGMGTLSVKVVIPKP